MPRAVVLLVLLALTPGCLVLSVNPTYDSESLTWDPALVGTWQDADDRSTLQLERGDWRSYRVHYVHPIETGDLTGYLTAIGDTHYLDLMPARGEDRGSFLVPVHAVLRVRVESDRLLLTALSYDWFYDRIHGGSGIPGLSAALDQKQNALIVSPVTKLREWLRRQPADGKMFGADAVFIRKPAS